MKRKQKGFTLAEMLIVVAVIAVLVAVAIPVFTNQLEKSRESTDLANVRAAYAAVVSAAITDDPSCKQADGTFQATVDLVQKQDGWTTDTEKLVLGGVPFSEWEGSPGAGGRCIVTVTPVTAASTISFSGGSGAGGGSGSGSGSTAVSVYVPLTDEMKSGASAVFDIFYNSGGQPVSQAVDGAGASPAIEGKIYKRNGYYYQVGPDPTVGGSAWYRWNESSNAWVKTYL